MVKFEVLYKYFNLIMYAQKTKNYLMFFRSNAKEDRVGKQNPIPSDNQEKGRRDHLRYTNYGK